MSRGKRKEPPEVKQGEPELLHPQITRTKYSDPMSERTVVTVTIPPLGNMEPGFHEALKGDLFNVERPLKSWADIQALIGFNELEAEESRRPKHLGHLGPVQRERLDRFSEEAFKLEAYQLIKPVLEAIADFSDENKDVVLNIVASRFLRAGMVLAEARIRQAQLENVVQGRGQLEMLRTQAKKQKGLSPATKRIGAKMEALIASGKTKSEAARHLKKAEKLKQDEGTLVTYHRRYKKSLDSP